MLRLARIWLANICTDKNLWRFRETTTIRQRVAAWLPDFIRTPIRNTLTYSNRLRIWILVICQVSGVYPRDKLVLWISFFAGPLSSLRSLSQWNDPVLLMDAKVRVSKVGKLWVRARSDDLYHVCPSRERAIFDVIFSSLEPGDCFVDGGANIGFYSMLAAGRVGHSGRVIAIEMMPDTADILRHHIDINGYDQIEVVEKALSDRNGGIVPAHVTDGKYGQASISGKRVSENSRVVEVEVTTIDDILQVDQQIRLMKLDLEGLELAALKGAERTLEKTHALIFECWTDDTEIVQFLEARDFSVKRLDRRNSLATRK